MNVRFLIFLARSAKNWIESNITLKDMNLSEEIRNFIQGIRVSMVSNILKMIR